jgi:hypothetical protein
MRRRLGKADRVPRAMYKITVHDSAFGRFVQALHGVRKSIAARSPVIPAKAGTQYSAALFVDECPCLWRGCHVSANAGVYWVSAFAGMTPLERDQEKWTPVFRPDRATSKRIESGQGAGMAPITLKPL